MNKTLTQIKVNGSNYPALPASQLENGMTYWDGSEITGVEVVGKTTRFTLERGELKVARVVRSASLIALSEEQECVVL